MPRRSYFVYIMANETRMTYIGVTNDLERRVLEHKAKVLQGYTSRYNITRLVYCEEYNDVWEALAREKQLKGWLRKRKTSLIESLNPRWSDLSAEWYDEREILRFAQDDTWAAQDDKTARDDHEERTP